VGLELFGRFDATTSRSASSDPAAKASAKSNAGSVAACHRPCTD
jgi:hypothetical protein